MGANAAIFILQTTVSQLLHVVMGRKEEQMEGNLQDDLVLFFAKFAVMVSNGIPLITALENLEKESTNQSLSQAAKKINESLVAGETLADGMKAFPDLFDERIIKLIRTGEETGSLDLIFRIIPEYLLYDGLKQWKK